MTFTLIAPATAVSAQAAPFLQFQGDAARTGFLDVRGPSTFDRAFRAEVGGLPLLATPPVVVDRAAYVLTNHDETGDGGGVWRIDLDTAEVDRIVLLEEAYDFWNPLASDGERLFLLDAGHVVAWDLAAGETAWRTELPVHLADPHTFQTCDEPAIRDGVMVLACEHWAGSWVTTPLGRVFLDRQALPYGVALDTATGDLIWHWHKELEEVTGQSTPTDVRPVSLDEMHGGSIVGDAVYFTLLDRYDQAVSEDPTDQITTDPVRLARPGTYTVAAVDLATGDQRWTRRMPLYAENYFVTATADPEGQGALVPQASLEWRPWVFGHTDQVYYMGLGELIALDPEDGTVRWTLPLQEPGQNRGVSAAAVAGDRIYVAAFTTLHVIDPGTREAVGRTRLDRTDPFQPLRDLLVTEDHIYAVSEGPAQQEDTVRAWTRDDDGPVEVFERAVAADPGAGVYWNPRLAVGEDVLVVADGAGGVHVHGTTAASPVARAEATSLYPAPGEEVRVDLSGTTAGVLGPATAYRADWGDRTETDWQTGPVLAHVYEHEGEREARFWVRNDAGQEASTRLTFDVGGTPPPEHNFLSEAFLPHNQDLTFGVLGIALALGAGSWAATKRHRRRRRMQDELAAIRAARDMADSPSEVQAALTERRAHVRGLLLDGKLDESQVAVLEGRIDELAREGRLAQLDGRLDYLPHGMVRKLEQALADGTITAWEREDLVRMVEDDGVLTKRQKRDTVTLIESWFAEDEGAGQE